MYVLLAVTRRKTKYLPDSAFVSFVVFSLRTAIISLNSVNRLDFVIETECAFSDVAPCECSIFRVFKLCSTQWDSLSHGDHTHANGRARTHGSPHSLAFEPFFRVRVTSFRRSAAAEVFVSPALLIKSYYPPTSSVICGLFNDVL
jgi:hypothetical protein